MNMIEKEESVSEKKASSYKVKEISKVLFQMKREISKIVFGQEEAVNSLFRGLLCNGHVLLE